MSTQFRVGITRDFLDGDGNLVFKDIGLHLLEQQPQVEVEFLKEFHLHVPPEQIQDFDALIVLKPHFTRDTFRGAERLTTIARFGVGYDRIDVDACTDANVLLFITPDGVRYPMAESVLTWLLMLCKHALQKDRLLRAGEWNPTAHMGICLRNRVLGLVGFGNIAREVVRLASPFGPRIIASDPYIDAAQASALGAEAVTLEQLLAQSDFVSIHCPLSSATRGLIGKPELELMKEEAYLINTARGPIVDERALIRALQSGQIAGAALDVFEQEPISPDNPLLQMDNVLLAPHAIGWSDELMLGNGTECCTGILKVMQGETPNHVVNTNVLQRPMLQAKLRFYRERFGV